MAKPIQNGPTKFIRFAPMTLRKDYDADDSSKDYANLTWSIRNGYPRITVYTTNKALSTGATDFTKVIIAPFDYITLMDILGKIKTLAESTLKDVKYSVQCKNIEYKNGEKTDNIVVQATVSYGKNSSGIMWLAATADDKRKLTFELLPNTRWFNYRDADNADVTLDKLSKEYTLTYINILMSLLKEEMGKDFTTSVLVDSKGIDIVKPVVKEPSTPIVDTNVNDTSTTVSAGLDELLDF